MRYLYCNVFLFFTVILAQILSFAVFAQNMVSINSARELRLYIKCTLQLTQNRPGTNDPDYKKILASQIKGIEGCRNLIASAEFNPQTGKLQTLDARSLALVKTMHILHKTFFSNLRYETSISENALAGTAYDVHDYNDPALYLTKSFFDATWAVKQILNGTKTYEAIRLDPITLTPVNDARSPHWRVEHSYYKIAPPDAPDSVDFSKLLSFSSLPFVNTGELMGVKELTLFYLPNISTTYVAGRADLAGTTIVRQNVPLHTSFGGGILGSTTYILLNFGKNTAFKTDGAMGVARMWSKNVLSDFLCKTLPAVRYEDAQFFVNSNSSIPFRKTQSCAQCHSHMDPLAGGIRNLRLVTTHGSVNGAEPIPAITRYPASLAKETVWPSESDNNFYMRPPSGQLFYRDSSGVLINTPYTDLNDLGRLITVQDDFYNCLASKYFYYFTNIKVKLIDPQIRALLSNEETAALNFVRKLGADLKSSQNLKALVRDILASEYY